MPHLELADGETDRARYYVIIVIIMLCFVLVVSPSRQCLIVHSKVACVVHTAAFSRNCMKQNVELSEHVHREVPDTHFTNRQSCQRQPVLCGP